MFEGLKEIGPQLADFWQRLTGAQKIAFLSVALITFGAGSLLFQAASEPEYGTLFANMDPADAANVVDELESANIPFRLTHAGTSIQVPVERIYDLRLELASKGLPASGPVGFEVFDEASLGMTPFQQQIQYRRALEGELGRTISRLRPVRWARVHINIPERSAFRRNRQDPTAAVVVSLSPGQSLTAAESAGVTQLVASAVEGLTAEKVSIVDSSGELLSTPTGEPQSQMAAGVLGMQKQIEQDLATRAQGLLDAALGAGKSVVTVSATINRKQFEETQNRIDPNETAVLSTVSTEETRSTPASAFGGIPGTPSNLPGGAPVQTATQNGTESITQETLNFEISRSQSTTVIPIGEITRLSVAVMVDGIYETPPAPPVPEGEEPSEDAVAQAPVYKPRTEEELLSYTKMVKQAVGFDEARGDTIEVQNIPFRDPLADLVLEPPSFWEGPLFRMLFPGVARGLLLLTGIGMVIWLVIRPALRQLAAPPPSRISESIAAAASGEDGRQLQLPTADAELAIPIGKDQAKQVAEAMRQWLRE